VAVKSNDEKIDPVGSLIGVGGERIKSVQRELAGEKIDIVRYTEDKAEFIRNAMTPAKGVEVLMSEDGRTADVIVPDDFLTAAIGKRGVNVRLASKLTGSELDVMNKKEYEEKLARNAGGKDNTLLGDHNPESVV
jgi:N utilization substance protein A